MQVSWLHATVSTSAILCRAVQLRGQKTLGLLRKTASSHMMSGCAQAHHMIGVFSQNTRVA